VSGLPYGRRPAICLGSNHRSSNEGSEGGPHWNFKHLLDAGALAACARLQRPFPRLSGRRRANHARRGHRDLSIEELGNIQITSCRGTRAPLRRSCSYFRDHGETSAARARPASRALRLAPNLEVARSSASSYAISARGFNNTIANKLLVLIDGRTVYTPLFSGVFWDAQDVMLEDVERIEVISGPGATLWAQTP